MRLERLIYLLGHMQILKVARQSLTLGGETNFEAGMHISEAHPV